MKHYVDSVGQPIVFPFYIVGFGPSNPGPVHPETLEIYSGFNPHFNGSEFKISSLADLVAFGEYIAANDPHNFKAAMSAVEPDFPLPTWDINERVRRVAEWMEYAGDRPGFDAGEGDPIVIDGELVTEAIAELRKKL